MAKVELRSVGKSFGEVPVLAGIDLDIADGEFLTLVGASGCGKSTLLRIIAGLEVQSSGSVLIDGAPVDHLRPHEQRVDLQLRGDRMNFARDLGHDAPPSQRQRTQERQAVEQSETRHDERQCNVAEHAHVRI